MNLHQYAVYIEQSVRNLIGKEVSRYALGGIVDADFIEYGGAFTAISAGLAKYYYDTNMEVIDKYLEKYSECNGVNFSDLGEEKVIEIYAELKNTIDNISLHTN